MSRIEEYIGPGIQLANGTMAPDHINDKKVVALAFVSNSKPESLNWARSQLMPFYGTVSASNQGALFEVLLVCPDEDVGAYNTVANAVQTPRLAHGDPMIPLLKQYHGIGKKVDFPALIVLAEDATEITFDGVTEMNPPPPTGG